MLAEAGKIPLLLPDTVTLHDRLHYTSNQAFRRFFCMLHKFKAAITSDLRVWGVLDHTSQIQHDCKVCFSGT